MHLYRIDPAGDREAVQALYGIHRAAEAAETPEGPILPAPSFCDWAAHGWSNEPREVWLGDSDGDGDRGTGPAAGGCLASAGVGGGLGGDITTRPGVVLIVGFFFRYKNYRTISYKSYLD
jgi:hypothetical protein